MRLKRVDISNYRSIKFESIEFQPRCRILVGKNEVGKSNILSACGLIDPAAAIEPADLRETLDGEEPVSSGHVAFVFSLSSNELRELGRAIQKRVHGTDALFSSREQAYSPVSLIDKCNEWFYIVKVPSGARSQRFWPWQEENFRIEPGWLRLKEGASPVQIKHEGKSYNLDRDSIVNARAVGGHHDFLRPVQIEEIELICIEEALKLFGNKLPGCLFWKYSETSLLPATIDIASFRENPRSCEPLRAMFLLAGHQDAADAIVKAQERPNGVKNLLTRVARMATEHVRSRWREVGSVEIVLSPNGSQIDAAVKDLFNEYAFSRRSDGFKRFISFLLLISARSTAKDFSETLFIQDEPDLGLHPSGVKSLLHELIEISANNYVLVSTHSIFMIDKERIDRHLVVSKSDEVTSVTEVDRSRIQDEEVLYNALGYSIFEIVKPINLVFEGWRDKKLFMTYLKGKREQAFFLSKRLGSDVGSVHAMGIKDIPKVIAYFDAIDRSCIIITDSDQVAKEKQRLMRSERDGLAWHRYDELADNDKTLTAEDFIKPQILHVAILEVLSANGIGHVLPASIFTNSGGENAVFNLDRALEEIPIEQEQRKKIINEWKSKIFDNISLDYIDESYDAVALGIAKAIGFHNE